MKTGRGSARTTLYNAKKAVVTAFRSSEGFRNALIHIAEGEGKDLSTWIVGVLRDALRERGVTLAPDLPEYEAVAAPGGSRNHRIEQMLAELMPIARERAEDWACASAENDVQKMLLEVTRINDPKLWNEVYEVIGWKGRTAREKVHALKFRMQAYAAPKG